MHYKRNPTKNTACALILYLKGGKGLGYSCLLSLQPHASSRNAQVQVAPSSLFTPALQGKSFFFHFADQKSKAQQIQVSQGQTSS